MFKGKRKNPDYGTPTVDPSSPKNTQFSRTVVEPQVKEYIRHGTFEEIIDSIGKHEVLDLTLITTESEYVTKYLLTDTLINKYPVNKLENYRYIFDCCTRRPRIAMYSEFDDCQKEELVQDIVSNLSDKGIEYMMTLTVLQDVKDHCKKLMKNSKEGNGTENNQVTQFTDYNQIKWRCKCTNSVANKHKLITKRFKDRIHSLKKDRKYKNKVYHDISVGNEIISNFVYPNEPWNDSRGNFEKKDKFSGNFSVIMAMGESVSLGIVHGSHRGPDTSGQIHLGSTSLVEIPGYCMIIFNGNLYHYGARSNYKFFQFTPNYRAFVYMCGQDTSFDDEESTYSMGGDRKWCKVACDRCTDIRIFLMANRCDEYMVWKYGPVNKVEGYYPGAYIMGDINTLGWSIVKAHHYDSEDLKLVDFTKKMSDVIGPLTEWHNIQKKKKYYGN